MSKILKHLVYLVVRDTKDVFPPSHRGREVAKVTNGFMKEIGIEKCESLVPWHLQIFKRTLWLRCGRDFVVVEPLFFFSVGCDCDGDLPKTLRNPAEWCHRLAAWLALKKIGFDLQYFTCESAVLNGTVVIFPNIIFGGGNQKTSG